MKQIGDTIDRYTIEGVLGRGGMGQVYEAVDSRLGRRLAVKVILNAGDTSATQRMMREARAAASFQHPNAVVVFDVGEADGATFLAMELVRGRSMRAYLGDRSVPLARRVRWLIDVARALGAAHRAGLVHRDVKPDNVMVREDGVVKVLDFGIARRVSFAVDPSAPTDVAAPGLATLTSEGVIVATPQYAAPEQLRRETVDGRTDEFAWGITAYELLSGSPPWRGEDAVALLAQILSAPAPDLAERVAGLPVEVARVVHHALEKDPAKRFATIDEAADALEPFAEPPALGTRTPSVPPAGAARDVAPTTAPEHTTRSPISRSVRPGERSEKSRALRRLAVGLAAIIVVVPMCLLVATVAKRVRGTSRRADDAPLVVKALQCRSAKLRGLSTDAELARAIGIGTCARLAVDLGVEWGDAGGVPVDVRAKKAKGGVELDVEVDDREVETTGPTPMVAMAKAVEAMRAKLAPPPMTDAEVQAWGAKDAASARKIKRLLWQVELRFAADAGGDVASLIAADPQSPWPYALANFFTVWGSDEWKDARDRALSLADKLPPPRAHILEGALLLDRSPANRERALALLRRGYTEAPDDPAVASVEALVLLSEGVRDEGLAALDRLYARFPTHSFFALRRALGDLPDRDLERDRRNVTRMIETLPESRAWFHPIQYLVISGKLDEARAALAFGRQFGMTSDSVEGAFLDLSEAQIALVSLDPATVREVGRRLLSDPLGRNAADGASFSIAAYRLEGRMVDAASLELTEVARHRTSGSARLGAKRAMDDLRHRRWLGQAAPDAGMSDWVEATLGRSSEVEPSLAAVARAEVALARLRSAGSKGKAAAALVLADIERVAETTRPGDKEARDSVLATTVALTRAVRGDDAAARRWRETDRAAFSVRRQAAFDAALALETVGDRDGARAAYVLAQDAIDIELGAFVSVASRLRLAALERAAGRSDEATRLEGEVARVWAGADHGLVERVRALR